MTQLGRRLGLFDVNMIVMDGIIGLGDFHQPAAAEETKLDSCGVSGGRLNRIRRCPSVSAY